MTPLSPSEARVLRLAAAGYSARESGEQLGRSAETVKTHRVHLLAKLGARNMTEAVAVAFRLGVLP